MGMAEATWSEQFTFQSTRWPDVTALCTVDFQEVDPEKMPGASHFKVRVAKNSDGPKPQVMTDSRSAFLREGNVDTTVNPRGTAFNVGAHEAGHMLGLGDEYPEEGAPDKVKHSDLVQAEFGHEVTRGTSDPDSVMHGGVIVKQEHGVTMLDALRKLTASAPIPTDWHSA
jgi:hypothetical protein